VLTFCTGPLQSATLERLSLDEMISQSTSIVRAKVGRSYGMLHGRVIYTHYRIQVQEWFKGVKPDLNEVVVPGGVANGRRQDVGGAPQLDTGAEYVLFLWTGKSGATHIVGLTQGVFTLPQNASEDTKAIRSASTELMLDPGTGRAVKDQRLEIRYGDLRARIAGVLRGSNQGAVR
jgi:hypothetical protein